MMHETCGHCLTVLEHCHIHEGSTFHTDSSDERILIDTSESRCYSGTPIERPPIKRPVIKVPKLLSVQCCKYNPC